MIRKKMDRNRFDAKKKWIPKLGFEFKQSPHQDSIRRDLNSKQIRLKIPKLGFEFLPKLRTEIPNLALSSKKLWVETPNSVSAELLTLLPLSLRPERAPSVYYFFVSLPPHSAHMSRPILPIFQNLIRFFFNSQGYFSLKLPKKEGEGWAQGGTGGEVDQAIFGKLGSSPVQREVPLTPRDYGSFAFSGAACTAIAVEVARAIVSSDSARLETSAIFLLNGGEETYMNAAHGFLTQHPWAEDVTQFVNIESTGSYGPDVVFRSNRWVLGESKSNRVHWADSLSLTLSCL